MCIRDRNHKEEKLVEMSNGCICCTLREDLLIEVTKLAKSQSFDYLLIESTGISEPLPVAETFTFEDEDGVSLSDVSKLDTMVTVVDAVNFLKDYDEAKYLQEVGESLCEEDERSVADLLVDQVEFADRILVSKTDLVTKAEIERLTAILRALNTEAEIIPIANGKVAIEEVLDTGLFDSVEYLTKVPKGFPWARDKYQYLPFGSTVIPWGPSISVGITPTSNLSSSINSDPSNLSKETISSDSAATYK